MRDAIKTDCLVITYDNGRSPLRPLQFVVSDILEEIKKAVSPLLKGYPGRLPGLCVHVQLSRSYLAIHGARWVFQYYTD